MKKQTQSNKPIILWDIHDVLLKRSGILRTLWNHPNWGRTVKHSSIGLLKDLLYLGCCHLFRKTSSEQYIQATRTHNNPDMEQLILQLTNAQQPIPDMKEIIDELHAAGYEQLVASNIGKTPFRALTDPNQFPLLAPVFQHINVEKSLFVSDENGLFIRKPNPQFFSFYLRKNNLNPKTTPFIFIDDNSKNIEAARTVGIEGILFKNPTQLREELQKRGLLP